MLVSKIISKKKLAILVRLLQNNNTIKGEHHAYRFLRNNETVFKEWQ